MRMVPVLFLIACSAGSDDSDSGESDPCAASWVPGPLEPDAAGPDTQIHGSSAFDGDHLWVAWNRRDDASRFDIWLERLDCGGAVDFGPVEITTTADSELDPALAVSGDTLMVAWSSDNGTGPANLDIRYRLFALDGTPRTDVIELSALRDGAVVEGNASGPDLAATDDGFVLAGYWGHPDATAFQAFGVAIDRAGAVQGEAVDAELDTAFGQTHVAVAHDGSRTHLVWQEDSTTSTAPAVSGGVLGEGSERLAEPAGRPDVAVGPGGVWRGWDDGSGGLVIRTPAGQDVALTGAGFLHDVSLATEDTGVVVLAMEVVTGIANRLRLWRLDADGTVRSQATLATEGAPSPYPVDLTLVGPDRAFVVYQDGPSPDFRLGAELVELQAP